MTGLYYYVHRCLLSKLHLDFSVFASPDFDTNEYANAILAGEPYLPSSDPKLTGKAIVTRPTTTQDPPAKEDISVAISKLTFGIDDVSKQIKNMVRMCVVSRDARLSFHRLQHTMRISSPKPQTRVIFRVLSHLSEEASPISIRHSRSGLWPVLTADLTLILK